MSDAIDLNPCPFCPSGGKPVLGGGLGIFGVCEVCECQGPPAATEAEAIAKWNGRYVPPSTQCEICEGILQAGRKTFCEDCAEDIAQSGRDDFERADCDDNSNGERA